MTELSLHFWRVDLGSKNIITDIKTFYDLHIFLQLLENRKSASENPELFSQDSLFVASSSTKENESLLRPAYELLVLVRNFLHHCGEPIALLLDLRLIPKALANGCLFENLHSKLTVLIQTAGSIMNFSHL